MRRFLLVVLTPISVLISLMIFSFLSFGGAGKAYAIPCYDCSPVGEGGYYSQGGYYSSYTEGYYYNQGYYSYSEGYYYNQGYYSYSEGYYYDQGYYSYSEGYYYNQGYYSYSEGYYYNQGYYSYSEGYYYNEGYYSYSEGYYYDQGYYSYSEGVYEGYYSYDEGYYSYSEGFYVPACTAPTILTHSDTDQGGAGTVTFSWSPVTGATQYTVQVQTGVGSWSIRQASSATNFPSGGSNNSDPLNDPNWRVFVSASDGSCSTPGSNVTFDPGVASTPTPTSTPIPTPTNAPGTFSISGTVYDDVNANGVRDPSENGVNNVTVTIPTIGSRTTNPSGNYSFTSVPSGNYSVDLTPPAGFVATTSDPAPATVPPNATVNFGVTDNLACQDGIDNDGNGLIDACEPGCDVNGIISDPANCANNPDYDPLDPSEKPECSDTINNDAIQGADAGDSDCHTDGQIVNPSSYMPNHPSESPIPPLCDGLTAIPPSIGAGETSTLTAVACVSLEPPAYTWPPPSIGTTVDVNNASTTYTAPGNLCSQQTAAQQVDVANSNGTSSYSTNITVTPRNTLSGQVRIDSSGNYCASGSTAYGGGGVDEVVQRGSVTTDKDEDGNVNIAKPSGVIEDDFLGVWICHDNSSETISPQQSGWTNAGVGQQDESTCWLYYKNAGASEPATYQFNFGDPDDAFTAIMFAYYNSGGGTVAYDKGVNLYKPSSSSTTTLPSITTANNNSMLLGFVNNENLDSDNRCSSWASPLTELADIGTDDDIATAFGAGIQAAAGPSGTKNVTCSSSDGGGFIAAIYGSGSPLGSGDSATVTVVKLGGPPPDPSDDTDSAGAYAVNDTRACGDRTSVISSIPNYRVIAARFDGGAWGTSGLSGFTYGPFDLSNNHTLDWCVTDVVPWFQTTTGDVRLSNLVNRVPSGKYASTDSSNPSVFYSSNFVTEFGSGTASTKGWAVNDEYTYQDDSKNRNGSMSYSFFVSRIAQQNVTVNNIPGCPGGDCETGISNLATGAYNLNTGNAGNLTITSYSHQAGARVLLLVNGDVNIQSNISVPAGSLLIIAAKGDITVDRSIGTTDLAAATPHINGILTAEGSIILDGTSCSGGTPDRRLNVGGVLVANSVKPFQVGGGGALVNNRSLCLQDRNYPTLYVTSRYDFVTQLTDFYKTSYTRWREIAP